MGNPNACRNPQRLIFSSKRRQSKVTHIILKPIKTSACLPGRRTQAAWATAKSLI